jgi:hypothetical protein
MENPGIAGKIILRWIFRKCDVGALTGSIELKIGFLWALVNTVTNLWVP